MKSVTKTFISRPPPLGDDRWLLRPSWSSPAKARNVRGWWMVGQPCANEINSRQPQRFLGSKVARHQKWLKPKRMRFGHGWPANGRSCRLFEAESARERSGWGFQQRRMGTYLSTQKPFSSTTKPLWSSWTNLVCTANQLIFYVNRPALEKKSKFHYNNVILYPYIPMQVYYKQFHGSIPLGETLASAAWIRPWPLERELLGGMESSAFVDFHVQAAERCSPEKPSSKRFSALIFIADIQLRNL